MDASLKKCLLRVKASGRSSCRASLFFLRDSSFENSGHILALFGDVSDGGHVLPHGSPTHNGAQAWAAGEVVGWGAAAPEGRLLESSCQVPSQLSALQGNACMCGLHFQEEAMYTCLSYTPRYMPAAHLWCYYGMSEQCSFH